MLTTSCLTAFSKIAAKHIVLSICPGSKPSLQNPVKRMPNNG